MKFDQGLEKDKICSDICWVVSESRQDKRTGFVGTPIAPDAYVDMEFNVIMKKWLKNYTPEETGTL